MIKIRRGNEEKAVGWVLMEKDWGVADEGLGGG